MTGTIDSMRNPFLEALWDSLTDFFTQVADNFVAIGEALVVGFGLAPKREVAREQTKKLSVEETHLRFTRLADELADLNERASALYNAEVDAAREARQEAENARALANMDDPERKATEDLVADAVERALNRNRQADKRFQIGVAIVSFVAGVLVTAASTAIGWYFTQK